MRVWLIAFFWVVFSDAALACGKAELQAFLALAQTLSSQTQSAGQRLLPCPGEVAEAAQWLAFYRTVAGVPGVPGRAAQPTVPSGPVGRAVAAAYNGSFEPLKQKLDAGDPEYIDQAEAQLAVGRMLVRQHRVTEGRRYYEAYLRLRPDAYAETAEYLYLPFWDKDWDGAERSLSNVSTASTPPPFTQAVERGKALARRLRGAPPDAAPASAGAVSARGSVLATGSIESYNVMGEMQRLTTEVAYHGPVDAGWRHHILHEQVYDQAVLNTDELFVGKKLTGLAKRFDVEAHAGYLTHGSEHYVGDVAGAAHVSKSWSVLAGADRRPLYATEPLAGPSLGLLEDHGFVGAGWKERVTWHSALLRDVGQEPFERHEVELRQPFAVGADPGAAVQLIAQAEYEARNRPSPDYETYRRTQRLGIGGGYARHLEGDWNADVEAVYSLMQRKPFGSESYLRHSALAAHARFSTEIVPALNASAAVAYAAEETDRPTQSVETRLSVIGAVELLR